MGHSPSPVEFSNNDLHSYVVVNDGRSYVAMSDIPDSLGPSLQPLSALGGVIGWAFALEQPGFKNGFSIVGEGETLDRLTEQAQNHLGSPLLCHFQVTVIVVICVTECFHLTQEACNC